jgi:hypothetical protein
MALPGQSLQALLSVGIRSPARAVKARPNSNEATDEPDHAEQYEECADHRDEQTVDEPPLRFAGAIRTTGELADALDSPLDRVRTVLRTERSRVDVASDCGKSSRFVATFRRTATRGTTHRVIVAPDRRGQGS